MPHSREDDASGFDVPRRLQKHSPTRRTYLFSALVHTANNTMLNPSFLLGLALFTRLSGAAQVPLTASNENAQGQQHGARYYELPNKIERVAVIGAGTGGLVHASTLLENGFQVRLFDRAPRPGGNWFYSDKTPIPASFPYASQTLIYIMTRRTDGSI